MNREKGEAWRQTDTEGGRPGSWEGRWWSTGPGAGGEGRLYAHFMGGSPGLSLIGWRAGEERAAVKTFSSGLSISRCHEESEAEKKDRQGRAGRGDELSSVFSHIAMETSAATP